MKNRHAHRTLLNPPRFFYAIISLAIITDGNLRAEEPSSNQQAPLSIIRAYLRATYARDFNGAYQFISLEDRQVRDVNRYVQQRGPYSGFLLEAARKLSEFIEAETVNAQELARGQRMTIKYRVPDPQKIASLLLNWDPYRMNSLPASDRKHLIELLEKRGRDRSFEMSQGEENFDLVKEATGWRIFLNWAAGIKIPVKLDLSNSSDLNVALSKNEVVLQPGDLFEIVLKIKNRAKQPVTLRIGHLVEPSGVADYLDFVQCGFLLPVTLPAEKEQEFSGTYMLRGTLPEGVRELILTYDFRPLK